MTIFIHKILACSNVNGTGKRSVVWTQGCSLNCKGCFNKSTHDFIANKGYETKMLAREVADFKQNGLTISGGEPLDQAESLLDFIMAFREISSSTILLFTGYTLDEIKSDDKKIRVIKNVDGVISGRYIEGKIWEGKNLLIISGRISPEDLKPLSQIEFISDNNENILTGYPELL
ncbi:radical SAM protein [Clostridium estertheticum]|uniref:4Fe-4S single cluster domain-containing protein n=1 Tax=Clostridium estertheticum TaxID=238834 RepID=UPI001C7D1BDE|nr:4Fe-4S single cluster domain-containing protein [Clostridium estertheticum]MBX4262353.1 radical SAM protein [Clostridium estertheticum]WLC71637.1 radical SAM protein [Clostridium estertheticum]